MRMQEKPELILRILATRAIDVLPGMIFVQLTWLYRRRTNNCVLRT
jgi:hypothetical protein